MVKHNIGPVSKNHLSDVTLHTAFQLGLTVGQSFKNHFNFFHSPIWGDLSDILRDIECLR